MLSGGINQNADSGLIESVPSLKRFQEVTRDAPDHIVAQLVGHDRVHEFGAASIEQLRKYRLGGDGFDRTCFAITEGETVHSAIYVHKTYDAVRGDSDFHGNVAHILAHEAAEDKRTPRSMIFYSISNITNVRGVGRLLVGELHTHLGQTFEQAKSSTLSPLRSFDLNFADEDRKRFLTMSVPEQKKIALQYLLTGVNDVQCFHMENGARLADIKLVPGDKSVHPATGKVCEHVAMVNYAYDMPADELYANAASFQAVKQAIRNKDGDPQQRQDVIARGVFARVSSALREEIGLKDADLSCSSSAPALRF